MDLNAINRPRFSVIVPIHNADQYLEECLTSLVQQTYKNIEIICVVNGSTDRSEEIVQDFALKDSRVSCHVLHDAGVSIARNYGIRVAKGEYVSFVDSDDWVDETLYELANSKLQNENIDCLFYCSWNVRGQKKFRNTSHDKLIKKVGDAPFSFFDFPKECINISASSCYKIIRRKLLLDKGIFFGEQLKSAEDTAFCVELYHKCNKIIILDKALYFYRIHSVGNSVTTRTPLIEIAKSCDYCLAKLGNELSEEARALVVNRFLQTILFVHGRAGSPRDSESISAIKYLYKQLPFFFRMTEKNEPKRARKLLLKSKMKNLTSVFFSKKKTEKYRLYKILGFDFKVLRSSYKKVLREHKQKRDHYVDVLNRLKSRDEKKYRVGFIVAEIQKWKCQSLFDLMKLEPNLTPVIVLVPFGKTVENIENTLNVNRQFFLANNMDHVVAWDYELKETLALDSFDLDIVFYQQPWAIDKKHSVPQVSKKSLTYYVPYYVPNYGNLKYDCRPFHFQLFKYYVFNQSWKDLYLTVMDGYDKELCPVGHPTLDFYLNNQSEAKKQYVIYAPHHSLQSYSIGYGTFEWSGDLILKFAEMHPELNWVYKPHPKLKEVLIHSNVMSKEEVESYWAAWEKLGEVYEGGEYIPKFNDSQCLITDCGSFLVEYFYTGKPVIHLTSSRTEEPVSALKEILDCYYQVRTRATLLSTMEEVLVLKKDPLKHQRESKVNQLTQGQESASLKILNDIKNTLGL